MMQVVMGLVAMLTGAIAVGVGLAAVRRTLHTTQRAYERTATLSSAGAEGWHDWFLSGFSGTTMGFRWLVTVAAGALWTLAGTCLIGLGLQLADRF